MAYIDDHAIDSLRVWFDLELNNLKEEWNTGEFEKVSECPNYETVNVYRNALNVLIKGCYLPEYVEQHIIPPITKMVKEN